MKLFLAVGLAATGLAAARRHPMISCEDWVDNSGTICYDDINYDKKCNAATFTEKDSCSVERCCTSKEKKMWCDDWADNNDIYCESGVNSDKQCVRGGHGATKCSEDFCCMKKVRVLSNCYDWTDGGDDCPPERANGWEHTLKSYQCFEWHVVKGLPAPTAQNGLGPCSRDQCCAKIKPTPKPDPPKPPQPKPCNQYATNSHNYDWRCDCWAAANNFSCPKGKYLQNGKQCTRFSGLYPNVPKCTDGHCCGGNPWVY